VLERFNNGEASCSEVCESLGIRRTRLYELRHEWLKDRDGFVPGVSGGDRNGGWPPECEKLALDLIGIGPVNFAPIADEMNRWFGFSRSRAAVRDYLAVRFPLLARGARPGPKPFLRSQCGRAGEIWQHDSTPVRIWPADRKQTLIATVDDNTRKVVLASVFGRETLWAHFVHLRRAFELFDIPETLYTDGFSMFGHEGDRDLATKCRGGYPRHSRKPSGSSSTRESDSGWLRDARTPSTRSGRQSWLAIRSDRRNPTTQAPLS